jgi:hypothetical protein
MRLKTNQLKRGEKPKSISLICAPGYKTMITPYKENEKQIVKLNFQST